MLAVSQADASLTPGSPVPTTPAWPGMQEGLQQPVQQQPVPVQSLVHSEPAPSMSVPPSSTSMSVTDSDMQQHQQQPILPATLPAPSPSSSAATGTTGTTPELAAVLDAHNKHRAHHGVPALVWDANLAASAAAWADGCPAGHSGQTGVGENMAWGQSTWTAAVDAWYDEVRLYNFTAPGWSSTTGHFTQVVWRDTTRLGCALESSCSSGATYVCQYKEPGNMMSADWAQQVPSEVS
jgi:uncharacterized protein YkwD